MPQQPEHSVHVIDANAFEQRLGRLLGGLERRIDETQALTLRDVEAAIERALAPLQAAVQGQATDLRDHATREERLFASAFPAGDPIEHRKAHEAMISAAKAQEQFWNSLWADLARKGVTAVLLSIVGLVALGALVVLAGKLGISWRP